MWPQSSSRPARWTHLLHSPRRFSRKYPNVHSHGRCADAAATGFASKRGRLHPVTPVLHAEALPDFGIHVVSRRVADRRSQHLAKQIALGCVVVKDRTRLVFLRQRSQIIRELGPLEGTRFGDIQSGSA